MFGQAVSWGRLDASVLGPLAELGKLAPVHLAAAVMAVDAWTVGRRRSIGGACPTPHRPDPLASLTATGPSFTPGEKSTPVLDPRHEHWHQESSPTAFCSPRAGRFSFGSGGCD